jgi:cytochrome oxidase Cu insertion factor (SCO1/SenC/PrrC family)
VRAAARVAVVLTLLVGVAGAAAPDFTALGLQAYQPPQAPPGFALPDLHGRTHTLSDYRGHVVLLFFWATW